LSMARDEYLFTSESVTEGHPDKIADQISDAVLDAIISQDPTGRVACESLLTTGLVVVAGEITTSCYVDIPRIARETIRDVGYTRAKFGFDYETCGVIAAIDEQSSDIAQGVDKLGAGDQGLMFGYACTETAELMPMPIMLAHKLVMRLSERRKSGALDYLRPDGKSQVTVRYVDGIPRAVETVIVSTQHGPDAGASRIREDIMQQVIIPTIPPELLDLKHCVFHVNPTGRYGTGKVPNHVLEQLVRRHFDFTPAGIIKYLDLRRPIYKKTAAYGHFGRSEPEFTWERTNRVKDLRDDAGV